MFGRNVRIYDVRYVWNLYREGRIQLRPDYQRNAVWPASARSYLIDTLIRNRPIPLLFLQPMASAQSGMPGYAVVDGQQRLLAIFDYLDDAFALSGPDIVARKGLRFGALPTSDQELILQYGLAVEELVGYSPRDIRDIFVRLNKYGVRLSPQELRRAQQSGLFKKAVESIAQWPFWRSERIVSPTKANRLRTEELVAELLILLMTGTPQDKKGSIDLYYGAFARRFPERRRVEARLRSYLDWIANVLAPYPKSRFRKPVDLYSLVAAIDRLIPPWQTPGQMDAGLAGRLLVQFEAATRAVPPKGDAGRYAVAASRQTDNVTPRLTRMTSLMNLLADLEA